MTYLFLWVGGQTVENPGESSRCCIVTLNLKNFKNNFEFHKRLYKSIK